MEYKQLMQKVARRIRIYISLRYYKLLKENGYIGEGPSNIFDYNSIIQDRKAPYIEKYKGNNLYGIGYVFREYSGYNGKMYCATEHAIPTKRVNNDIEIKKHNMPIVLVASESRKAIIQPYTDKLIISYGTHFLPYVKGIYSEFMVKSTKQNLGKTMLVFPQHNNVDSMYLDTKKTRKDLIDYIEKLKKEHQFETILVCCYFADIENGMYHDFEQMGWRVVTAGKNTNYDFPKYMKTLYELADLVVSQGSYSSVIQAVYMDKPTMYLKGERKIRLADDEIQNQEEALNLSDTYEECYRLFGEYSEVISSEQKEWCNKWGGYDSIRSPKEMKKLFEYAKKVRRKGKNDKYLLKVLSRKKYAIIKDIVLEAIKGRKSSVGNENEFPR